MPALPRPSIGPPPYLALARTAAEMAIGRTEDRDTPRDPVMLQHRLKCLGLDPRNPSGPAVMPTAYKGRTHDRNRPDPSQLQKNTCKPAAVHTWIPAFAGMTIFFDP